MRHDCLGRGQSPRSALRRANLSGAFARPAGWDPVPCPRRRARFRARSTGSASLSRARNCGSAPGCFEPQAYGICARHVPGAGLPEQRRARPWTSAPDTDRSGRIHHGIDGIEGGEALICPDGDRALPTRVGQSFARRAFTPRPRGRRGQPTPRGSLCEVRWQSGPKDNCQRENQGSGGNRLMFQAVHWHPHKWSC